MKKLLILAATFLALSSVKAQMDQADKTRVDSTEGGDARFFVTKVTNRASIVTRTFAVNGSKAIYDEHYKGSRIKSWSMTVYWRDGRIEKYEGKSQDRLSDILKAMSYGDYYDPYRGGYILGSDGIFRSQANQIGNIIRSGDPAYGTYRTARYGG